MSDDTKDTVPEAGAALLEAQRRWLERKAHLLRHPAQATPEEVRRLLAEGGRAYELLAAAQPLAQAAARYEESMATGRGLETAAYELLTGARRLLRALECLR